MMIMIVVSNYRTDCDEPRNVLDGGCVSGPALITEYADRLPWRTARRAVVLGTAIGCTMSGLRWGQSQLRRARGAVGSSAE